MSNNEQPLADEQTTGYITRRTYFKENFAEKIAIPLISITMSFIIASGILLMMGYNPYVALYYLTYGTFSNPKKILDILFVSTPLIFTGLAVAVAFRAGMFNIGVEGQIYFGAFCSAFVGFAFADITRIILPFYLMIPLMIIAGMFGGAVWALIPALLKAKRGVHEVITTIMMNYIAYTLMVFFVGDPVSSPFIDRNYTTGGNFQPRTPYIDPSGYLPSLDFIDSGSSIHFGLIIAILASIVVFIILWQTKFGYDIRAVGFNPNASKYGGINVSRNLIYVMLISGALGGLAGTVEVMGFYHYFLNNFSPGYGFDGIAVALIGANHPIGVIFGALLFGWLKTGGTVLQLNGIPKDIAATLQAMIVFFVAIPLLSRQIYRYFSRNPISFENIKLKISSVRNTFLHERGIFFVIACIYLKIIIIDTLATENRIVLLLLSLLGFAILRYYISNMHISFLSRYFDSRIAKMQLFPKYGDYIAVTAGIFSIFAFIDLIAEFGTELVLFGLLGIIFLFMIIQMLTGKRKKYTSLILAEHDTKDATTKTTIYSYLYLSGITFLLLISMLSFSDIQTEFVLVIIPNELDFHFSNLGVITAIIGTILIIISFIGLNRLKKMTYRTKSSIYYLNSLFFTMAIIFGFMAITVMFNLNPVLLFRQTLSIGAPIGLAALGGMYSEKSGVVNIGLEGMMLSGAFSAVAGTFITGNPWIGVMCALVTGILLGILHGIASIKYRADQVVVGVALNLLASSLTTLGLIFVWNKRGTSDIVASLPKIELAFLLDIPIIGELLYAILNGYDPLIYIFVALIIISTWVINNTIFGLHVRAVGEHPKAVDTLGLNVYRLRYISVMISGILAAAGGAQLSLGAVSVFGKDMTTGRGYIGLAALIFGSWAPIGAGLASLLFSFAYAFRFQLEAQNISFIFFSLPLEKLTPAIPYVITILSVALVVKRSRAPAADGIPYVTEEQS